MPIDVARMRLVNLASLLCVLLACGTPLTAFAQIAPSAPVFIVNLAVPDRGFTTVSAATLDEALRALIAADDKARTTKVVEDAGDRLDALMASCRPDPDGKPRPNTDIVKRLYDCADCVSGYRETRFLTKRGDEVALIVLYDGNLIKDSRLIRAFFAETPRDSELIATAKALRNLIQQETQALLTPAPTCIAFTHTLQHNRSHLKAIVTAPAPTARTESAVSSPLINPGTTAAAPAASAGQALESGPVTLGPEERWFFSADFSISKASVSFGEDPTVSQELIKSKDFFVALNFGLSDLLPDRANPLARRPFWRELVLKVQVLPSKEPWSAWAAGVGLRGYRIKTILWNMDVVHPYVTVGRQTLDGGAKWRVAGGLGFDPRSLQRGN